MIRYNCPHCRCPLESPESKALQSFACPDCRRVIVVPAAEAPATPGPDALLRPRPLRPVLEGIRRFGLHPALKWTLLLAALPVLLALAALAWSEAGEEHLLALIYLV